MTEQSEPTIGIIFADDFPHKPFLDAVEALNQNGVTAVAREQPSGILYASLEWLIPTAIGAYLTKGYFDGFLSEAGADHFRLLKKILSGLFAKFSSVKMVAVGSHGKVGDTNPFSRVFAIEAEAMSGVRFKLLLQNDLTALQIGQATEHFLDFVARFHLEQLTTEARSEIDAYVIRGSRILICFEHDHNQLRLVDILESRGNAVELRLLP